MGFRYGSPVYHDADQGILSSATGEKKDAPLEWNAPINVVMEYAERVNSWRAPNRLAYFQVFGPLCETLREASQ
jgi:hypothetical protein